MSIRLMTAIRDLMGQSESVQVEARAQETQRLGEIYFQSMLDDITELICRFLPDGTLTYVNDAYCRYYGISRDELIGTSFIPEGADDFPQKHLEYFKSFTPDHPTSSFEQHDYLPNGEKRWREWLDRAFFDKHGNVIEFQSIGRDITERKRAEETLRDREAQLSGVIQSTLDAIISIDEEQRILLFNPAAERLFKCPASEAVGFLLDRFIPEPARASHPGFVRAYGHSNATQRTMGTPTLELSCLRADGELFPSEISISQYEVNGKKRFIASIRDITERKRAEEATQESEERFRASFEQVAVGIAHVSADGRWLRVNQRLCDIVGYTREELLTKSFQDITHPDDLETDLDFVRQVLDDKIKTYSMEKRYLCKDGSIVWINLTVSLVRNTTGQAKYFISVVEDITQRKQAREALRIAEKRFRTLIEKSSDGIMLIGMGGEILYQSPSSQSILGYDPAEQIGQNVFDFIHPDDLTMAKNTFTEILQRDDKALNAEVRYRYKDGSWRWLDAIGTNLFAEPGIQALVANYRDITERKRTEEQLRYQALMLENVSDVIVSTDMNGLIRSWNKAAEKALGYSEAEVIGRPAAEVVSNEYVTSSREEAFLQLREQGYWEGEVRVYARDGRTMHTIASASVIKDNTDSPIGFLSMNHDISDRQQTEAALRASEERYRDLVENSQELICMHDLEGNILSANPAGVAMIGYSMEEILKMNIRDLLAPEAKKSFTNYIKLLKRAGKASGLMLVQTRTGEKRLWEYNNTLRTEGVAKPIVRGMARDITERKQAEEKLRRSENRYRLATKATNDVIWEWDFQANQLIWTENAQTVFGYTPEEIEPYETWWEVHLHPDDRQRVLSILNALLASDESIWTESYRFLLKNGSYADISDRGYIERDASGKPIRMIGAMSDVTERKRAEKQIQQQLKRLNALYGIDMAILSSFDLKVILSVVLQQVLSELGADASAILLFNPDLQTLEYAASRGFHSNALHQTKLKLGEGYAGQVMLKRKTIHITNLMGTGSNLAQVLQLEGETFAEYYGVPLIVKGEIRGVLEVYHRSHMKTDAEWLEFLETLAGQAAIAIDNTQLFENLQRSNATLEHRVIERTAELHRANMELERANRAKDEFLATMSHELRTPLNSILGLSESLLEEKRGLLNQHQQRSLQTIESSGRHLLELINDILEVSKIQAGKFDFYPQAISVDELCRSSLAFVRAQAAKKSIRLNYLNEAAIPRIYADPRRLKQILVNLLGNAVKFTPENGNVTLQVRSDLEQELIRLAVLDTGIGIAHEDLQRLFQPFVQVQSSLNREYEGTGLGLALIQKLTDLHGGSVQVESEVGVGSQFTINLPLQQDLIARQEMMEAGAKPLSAEAAVEAKLPPSELADRGLILLAEDNSANILTIGEYLKSHGYEIVVAGDGLEAIQQAEAVNPEIILMDIQMPVMDGLEAIRRLRKDSRFTKTPIIALTALAMPGDRERCLEAGANEYMSKPVQLKSLVKTIEGLLRQQNH